MKKNEKHSSNKSKRKNKNNIDNELIAKIDSKEQRRTTTKKQEKELKKLKKQKKKKFIKRIISIIIIAIIILGIWFGISMHKWQELAKEMINNKHSVVLDSDGNIVAELGSEKINETVTFTQIPDNLKNAYVSIEDERFYKHHGVDTKRTIAAIGSYVIHLGNSSFGGSTITQQLVKNMTGDDSTSITRKVNEWVKAIELEACLSKDEILETYMNIIYVGPNVYGVQKGAEYYFNKSVSDLSLAECAFLAGLTHSPNSYNPFTETDRTEKITKRSKTVLNKMLELNYISEDEYNSAISELEAGLHFSKGDVASNNNGIYSYHTDAIISELIEDISKKKHISKTFTTNYLHMAGLTIYGTQNSSIQQNMEKEFENNKYILKSKNDANATSQAAMVIINQYNGQVLGCVGGLGEKNTSRGLNRVTQSIRQTGSASKPITVLIPALSKKIITASSIYDDSATTFKNIDNTDYSPTDYNHYLGEITVRRAVESSQNIPFVKIMNELTPKTSIKYLKKMGITTLTENDNNLSLALGGLDQGISPLEMAGAYATIANNGVYIEPIFYTKVTSADGKTLIEKKQKTRRVFSEDVAYIVKELLTQPVTGNSGTATYCSISGMDVAAKTGTTNDNYDRWLCGFTNYYTGVTWYGYDLNEEIDYNGKNPAAIIWADVMRNIHKNLSNSSFSATKNIRSANICAETGKTATSACTNTYTEYFLKGTVPEQCTEHTGSSKKTTTNNSNNKTQNNSKQNTTTTENTNTENNTSTNIVNNTINNKTTSNESSNTSSKNNTSTNKTNNTTTNNTNSSKNNNSTSVKNTTKSNNTNNDTSN